MMLCYHELKKRMIEVRFNLPIVAEAVVLVELVQQAGL
jgi:hypothetical protein